MHLMPNIHHALANVEKSDHLVKVLVVTRLEALAVMQNKTSVFLGDNLFVDI